MRCYRKCTIAIDKFRTFNNRSSYISGHEEISDSYIKATNGKWQLNSLTGYATFTGAKINGVDIGSTFGGLTYNGNGTHGNFNNGFTADRSFGVTGGALNNFNSLVANKVTAAYMLFLNPL